MLRQKASTPQWIRQPEAATRIGTPVAAGTGECSAEAAAGRRRYEEEGKAAAQAACAPAAGVSVRGCARAHTRGAHQPREHCSCAHTHPGRARASCAPQLRAGLASHPADSNSSACAVEMSTVCVLLLQVGKSPDTAWRALLATKVLSEAAPILEDYGLSCENDLSLLDQDDLMTLCSKLKQFPSKLLRKWVQGLADEQKAAADMNDAPAANTHSNSPPSEDEGEEEEHEEENGDEDEDSDEQGIQMWKTRRPTVVQRASKKVRGMGKLMKTCASSGRRARSIIRRMESEPRKA
jgi:hypothetical protein